MTVYIAGEKDIQLKTFARGTAQIIQHQINYYNQILI